MRLAAGLLSCLLVASCGGSETSGAPRVPTGEMTEEPHHGDESLILYVGNESGEVPTLDFEIAIDGSVVARDVIERVDLVEPQPHREIRLSLAPGEHLLEARTRRGDASLSTRFTISGKHWACLTYWNYSGTAHSKPIPRSLDFRIYDERPRFL